MDTYEVVRFYREGHPQEIVAEGLTLAEAKEMCQDEEGHSNTCGSTEGMRLFAEKGEWFLGFRKE
jgi:hypothetical protein